MTKKLVSFDEATGQLPAAVNATLYAAFVPKWAPGAGYLLGAQVVNPSNDVVTATVAHTSSAAYATDVAKWSGSSTYARVGGGFLKSFKSGRYYIHSGNMTSGDPGVNYLYLMPFEVPVACTLDRLGIEVVIGIATGVTRLGIYLGDANDIPTTLLLDAGTVATTAAAKVETTISQAVPAGIIWLAMVNQTASATLRVYSGGFAEIGSTTLNGILQAQLQSSYYQSGVSGALPTTLALTGVSQYGPIVAVRAA